MFKQMKVWFVLTIILSLLALGSSCGGSGTNDAASGYKLNRIDRWQALLRARVTREQLPEPSHITALHRLRRKSTRLPIRSAGRPTRTSRQKTLSLKTANSRMSFVYIKDGTTADGTKIAEITFPTPTDAVALDQKGCHYVPHVLGIQANQKLRITNSDPTQHNIHPTPKSQSGVEPDPV